MQNSALSWITVVRHLESSFASFAPARSRSACTCTINTNSSEVSVAWSCESLDSFPCSFRCRSVWIRKLVAVRVVVLDTSGPMATNCGDVWVLRPGKKERPKSPHFERIKWRPQQRIHNRASLNPRSILFGNDPPETSATPRLRKQVERKH